MDLTLPENPATAEDLTLIICATMLSLSKLPESISNQDIRHHMCCCTEPKHKISNIPRYIARIKQLHLQLHQFLRGRITIFDIITIETINITSITTRLKKQFDIAFNYNFYHNQQRWTDSVVMRITSRSHCLGFTSETSPTPEFGYSLTATPHRQNCASQRNRIPKLGSNLTTIYEEPLAHVANSPAQRLKFSRNNTQHAPNITITDADLNYNFLAIPIGIRRAWLVSAKRKTLLPNFEHIRKAYKDLIQSQSADQMNPLIAHIFPNNPHPTVEDIDRLFKVIAENIVIGNVAMFRQT